MYRVAITYSINGAIFAKNLCLEMEKATPSWSAKHYLISDRTAARNFWEPIREGKFDKNIIIFICTKDFFEVNHYELERTKKSYNRYNCKFIWILIDQSVLVPRYLNYNDIKITIDKNIFNKEKEKKEFISQIIDYVELAEHIRKKEIRIDRNQKRRKNRFIYQTISLFMGYLSIITCSFLVMIKGIHHTYSAESILILTALFSVIFLLVSVILIFNNRQKKLYQKEKSDFDKELDMSLSKSSYILTNTNNYDQNALEYLDNQSISGEQLLQFMHSHSKYNPKPDSETNNGDSDEKEITRAIGDSDYLPLGHLKFNWKQMKGYYDISKKQAKTSFAWAIIICFLGISMIIFAALSPLIPHFASEDSLVQIIGSIGGAVVELFAGTILIVYIKTLSQMNIYHKALSEYQRYLSCINLVSKIRNKEKQDELYEAIIREEMKKSIDINENDLKPIKDFSHKQKSSN